MANPHQTQKLKTVQPYKKMWEGKGAEKKKKSKARNKKNGKWKNATISYSDRRIKRNEVLFVCVYEFQAIESVGVGRNYKETQTKGYKNKKAKQEHKRKMEKKRKHVNPLKILKCFWNKTISQGKQRMLQIYASKTYQPICQPVTFGHTQTDTKKSRKRRRREKKDDKSAEALHVQYMMDQRPFRRIVVSCLIQTVTAKNLITISVGGTQ